MKMHSVLYVALLTVLAYAASLITNVASPGPSRTSAAQAPTPPSADVHYVGTKKCRMCHSQWHDAWLDSPKSDHAWDVLKPSTSVESKTAAGLDPAADYRTDERCLACHAVGFGKPGGYVVPAPDDRRAQRHAESLRGVGCEACHGPGSAYIEVMRKIMNEKKSYLRDDLAAKGLHTMTPDRCDACHNDHALCVVFGAGQERADRLDKVRVDAVSSQSAHITFPLKFRLPSAPPSPHSD